MILLRSIAFNIFFYLVTAVLALGGVVARRLDRGPAPPNGPAPAWARWIARRWAALTIGGLRVICGARWEVSGLEHLPQDGPALIASMHQSAFDTMVWMLLVPQPCYVLKRELVRIPVFGSMCVSTDMIAVDRDGGAQAIRALLRATNRAVVQRRHIVIFPEGTRMPPGQIGTLQPGIAAMASRAGLPVIPIATDSGHCWGRRAFRKRPGMIRIRIGPAITAGLPRAELLARLEQAFVDGAQALADPNVASR